MQRKWTSVLVTGALAGSLAVTTGIAISHAAPDNHPMISPVLGSPDAPRTLAAVGDLGAVLHLVGDLAAHSTPSNGSADPATLKSELAALDAAAGRLKSSLPAPAGSTAGDQSAPAVPASPVPYAPPAGAASSAAVASSVLPSVSGLVAAVFPAASGSASGAASPAAVGQPAAAAAVNPGGPEQSGAAQVPGGPVQLGGPIQRDAQSDAQAGAVKGVAELLSSLQQHAAALVSAATAKQPDATAVQKAMGPLSADALQLSTAAVNRLSGR